MDELLLVALAGFCASLVDGALGMGLGQPAEASCSEPASVQRRSRARSTSPRSQPASPGHLPLAVPQHRSPTGPPARDSVGAVAGVTVLSQVDGDTLRPIWRHVILVGIRTRAVRRPGHHRPQGVHDGEPTRPHAAFQSARGRPVRRRRWRDQRARRRLGPIVTPVLFHRGLSPRFAVGSVNTAEVLSRRCRRINPRVGR